MTHSEINPSALAAEPEIIIQNDGNKVHFHVVVGPVRNSKTFKAKRRSKGLDWAADQVQQIQASLEKHMRNISV